MLLFDQRRDLSRQYQKWTEENDVKDCSFSVISFLVLNHLIDEDKARIFLAQGKEGVARFESGEEDTGLKNCTCGGFPKRILVAIPDLTQMHYSYECCNCGRRSLPGAHRSLAKENWNNSIE